jgi:DNA repair ATPase RecN
MLLATEIADQSVSTFAVGALVLGGIAALGFFVRKAFEDTTKAVADLGEKLEALAKDISKGDGDRRVLERDIMAHTQRLDAEARRLDKLESRVERLEQLRRDDSEGVVR